MKVKNKRTVDNFEPSVLKNMILLSLSSNKDKFKFEEDFLGFDKCVSNYEFLVNLFLDEVNKVIMTKPLKKYIYKEEDLYYVKGKINIKKTIIINYNNKVSCVYDYMSLDNSLNRIVKSIIYYLLNTYYICKNKKLKNRLLNTYYYFNDVRVIDVNLSDLDSIRFDSNNLNYEVLIVICRYLLGSVRKDNHNRKYIDVDSYLWWVYQEFIRNYYFYNKRVLNINDVLSSKYEWDLEPLEDANISLLPNMRTDIEIEKDDEIIIIDAKCYETSLVEYRNKKMFISDNLYQLTSYLDVCKCKYPNKKLRGVLIYPYNHCLNDLNALRQKYKRYDGSYEIEVVTIDFKQKWEDVCKELNEII